MKNLIKLSLILSLFILPAVSFGQEAKVTSNCTGFALTYNMGPGSTDYYTGGEVTILQNFLVSKGYGTFSGRGYYGPLTFAAVQNFQRANNISAVGYVGPFTRAKIQALSCGNISSNVSITSISQSSGPIGTTVTLTGTGFGVVPPYPTLTNNSLGFAYAGNTIYLDNLPALRVDAVNSTTLTFTIPYYLELTPGIHILPGPLMIKLVNNYGTSNSLTFNVTEGNINQQAPIISSINPIRGTVGTQVVILGTAFTDSNTIKFGSYTVGTNPAYGTGACFSGNSCSNFQNLTFTVPQYAGLYCAPGMSCAAIAAQITPGVFPVTVINANGTSNSVNFTVTSTSSTGGTIPTINGLNAPTTLTVGQAGTWKVNATDPQGGTLNYSVDWGDATNNNCNYYNGYYTCPQTSGSASARYQQDSTFTHSYTNSGTYTIKFTVGNSSGQTAQTSTTVQVGNSSSATAPYISYASPAYGPTGTYITLYGNFSQNGNKINFGNYEEYNLSNLSSYNGNTISFYVPYGDDFACQHSYPACVPANHQVVPGTYNISVTNTNGTSNSTSFTVTQ